MSQDDKAALKDTEVGRIEAEIACSNMRQVLSRKKWQQCLLLGGILKCSKENK